MQREASAGEMERAKKGPGNGESVIFREDVFGVYMLGFPSTLSTGSSIDFCLEQPKGMGYLERIPWLK